MFSKYTTSFLKDFDFKEIISKFSLREFRFFKEGTFIFSENETVSNIYFVISGKVEIRKYPIKKIKSLYCIGAGDIIGFDDALIGENYFNSAYVLQNTNTISVKKNDFLNIMKSNDELNLWILKYLSCRINSLG